MNFKENIEKEKVEILPFGNSAILINFEQLIHSETHKKVLSLANALEHSNLKEIEYLIPAYSSLTIGYKADLNTLKFEELKKEIEKLLDNKSEQPSHSTSKIIEIPVCYDEEFGLDISEVSKQTGLPKQEIINLHTSTKFAVFMLGFLPGFPYLGTLPEALKVTRKSNPRVRVPSLSVGLAGLQTGIYPAEAPGGWQIIGKTTREVFDPLKENPFFLKAGNAVQFYEISKQEYLSQTQKK